MPIKMIGNQLVPRKHGLKWIKYPSWRLIFYFILSNLIFLNSKYPVFSFSFPQLPSSFPPKSILTYCTISLIITCPWNDQLSCLFKRFKWNVQSSFLAFYLKKIMLSLSQYFIYFLIIINYSTNILIICWFTHFLFVSLPWNIISILIHYST